ncbi:MAG: type 2 lantipeptide synthetase LanM [Myxococcales bacterium]|nr:type 2 lantipeptide synthetase LanM [Myxococcales bacterium]
MATTLRERVEIMRSRPSPRPVDAERGARELESWRAQLGASPSSELLAARLELDGISELQLEQILGTELTPGADEAGPPPAWVSTLERAYAAGGGEPWSIEVDADAGELRTLRFLELVEPLVRQARDGLRARVEAVLAEHPGAPFDGPTAVRCMLASLPWTLHAMLMRAVVLELNVARMRGELNGETPEERFDAFVRRLSEPRRALTFLAEYPVLARSLVRTLDKWERASAELLLHLARDAEALRETFGDVLGPRARLTRVDGGAGDVHRDGRSVLIVHFGDERLVYKPRSLAVDVHFQALLRWLGQRAKIPSLRTLTVLERGDHGWVELVKAGPCRSLDEVRRFYQRQGALLALLHALEAVDFHYENLIAAGEHPVLVDLESLFHARLGETPELEPEHRLVGEATARSVMRIGILPQRVPGREGQPGPDLSGLAGAPGQLTPTAVLQWDGLGTDRMHARREHLPMPGGANLPALEGEATDVLRFEGDLAEGFVAVYRALVEHRGALLADDGPIAAFADDEVRCVLRATRVYGMLLTEAFHPDHLRDGLERERLLDRIWVGVETMPHLRRVVGHERAELEHGDVPLFTTRVGSRDLWSGGGERVAEMLPTTGLQQVIERIRSLDESDLARQRWYLRASLATLEISRATVEWSRYPEVEVEPEPEPARLRERAREAALAVGDRLIDLALRDDEAITWVGLCYDDTYWSLAPLLEDLYAGSAGLACFFAFLGEVGGRAQHTEVAREVLRGLRRRLGLVADQLRSVGAFNGWGGSIWTLTHCGRLWGEDELIDEAAAIARRCASLVDADEDLDVIGGSAGLILTLGGLHRVRPDDEWIAIASRAGDHLLSRAREVNGGLGWFSRIETMRPITGMSHGAAGIAWALAELFGLTGEERYRDAALGAIRYERSRLVPMLGNWLETDQSDEKALRHKGSSALSVAWCYGAPGIALARLRCGQQIDDAGIREDLAVALRTTVEQGFGRNHSLCHGDLGNLDVLAQVSRSTGDVALARTCDRILAMTLASIDADGLRCGVPLGVESPSLMNGLAGIGYGLLRAAHPERVPSVLGLDPPLPEGPSSPG